MRLPASLKSFFGERDRLAQWVFLASSTLIGLWARGRWVFPLNDGGFAWSVAYRLGHGELLYRDIYFVYGPLSPYLLALTGRPFDYSALWYLFANWVPAVIAGWLVLECSRGFLTRLQSLAVAGLLLGLSLFVAGWGRLVYTYYPGVVHALALSLGALLILKRHANRPGRGALAAGLLAGLALSCKPEIGVAAELALLAACLAGLPRPVSWGVGVAAGFALVGAASFAFALSCDSLASLSANSHLWPLNPSPPPALQYLLRHAAGFRYPGLALAVRSAAFHLLWQCGCVALAALAISRERSPRRWLPLAGLFGLLGIWFAVEGFDLFHPPSYVTLSMSVSILTGAWIFFQPGVEGRPFLFAFCVFAALAGSRTAFSTNLGEAYGGPAHLASSFTWVFFLCCLLAPLLVGYGKATPLARTLFAVAILVAVAPPLRDGVVALSGPKYFAVPTRRGSVYLDEGWSRLFEALGRELRPGERVLTVPEVSAVDVLFDVRHPSPFVNHLPGWLDADGEKREIARLEQSPPDAIVILLRSTSVYGVEPFGRGFCRELAAWIASRYRPVVERNVGTVLRRREEPAPTAAPKTSDAPAR